MTSSLLGGIQTPPPPCHHVMTKWRHHFWGVSRPPPLKWWRHLWTAPYLNATTWKGRCDFKNSSPNRNRANNLQKWIIIWCMYMLWFLANLTSIPSQKKKFLKLQECLQYVGNAACLLRRARCGLSFCFVHLSFCFVHLSSMFCTFSFCFVHL